MCKKKRSVLNGSAVVGGQDNNTFFARKDTSDQPCTRIGIHVVLLLVWCWSQKFTVAQTLTTVADLVSHRLTIVDWFNYVHEFCLESLTAAPAMGQHKDTPFLEILGEVEPESSRSY